MDVEKLLELIEDYYPDEVEKVKKAYLYTAYLHDGQYRESGEAYIICKLLNIKHHSNKKKNL